MKEKPKDDKDLKDLIEASKLAAAGVDDGFWNDVAAQLDKADEAAKVPVEGRLTRAR